MASIDEQILRATKEIMVRIEEVGRVYPASFSETFKNVYHAVEGAVKGLESPPEKGDGKKKKKT